MNKRQRAQAKAEKRRAKEERRWRKRDEGPSEDEIVSATDIVGNLPSIDQAMRNSPVPDRNAPPPRIEGQVPARLFVGRLSWDTTEQTLRRRFEKFAVVVDAVVAHDRETGRSRGFGFVELADERDAEGVIDALDGSELDGRAIVVNLATERSRRAPRRPSAHSDEAKSVSQ